MGLIESIQGVASFAEPEGRSLSPHWSTIQFAPGAVYAQSPRSGSRAQTDLDFTCSVGAHRLLKAFKAVGGTPTLSLTKKGLQVRSGAAKATLPMINGSNAPSLGRPEGIEWHECAALADVARVAWGASTDPARTNLCGIHLGSNGLEVTNGHALARLRGTDFVALLGAAVDVPPEVLKGLRSESWIGREGKRLFIAEDAEGSSFRCCVPFTEGFPPTDEIISSTSDLPSARVVRKPFAELIKRAKVSSAMLVLSVADGQLSVNSDDSRSDTLFAFADSVPLLDSAVKDVRVGMDSAYLIPLVDHCVSDEVTIKIGGPLDPIVVEDGNYLGVVMPYRL